MRLFLYCVVLLSALATPATAQEPDSAPTDARRATSEERAAEIKAAIEKGRTRQNAVDAHNTDLWKRWTYAVCIGCGPIPKGLRIVYTTPARVLAGIPAAEDDARQRSRSAGRSPRRWASGIMAI